ncbi:MAG: sodium-dependent transporter [Muribaculaceae bacterium]|nr:sodium-dependent transporter [Muribaculaceae bacterium]
MSKKDSFKDRAVFATRFAAIATTVGSAVGLGNIWRFPYETGAHGGGAFLVCYLAFVLLIGIPVLWAEFYMGRTTRSNVFGAYRKLKAGPIGRVAGIIGIVSSLLILSFYSVVAGWTAEYFVSSLLGQLDFADKAVGHDQFVTMTTGWRPVQWTVLFLFCNTFILLRGVTKGIERASNILMPLLFLLLIVFCINAFTMPGFGRGVSYLFKPDFSQINASVLLSAMGQAFFSLSLGLGCMMTYASYFSSRNNLACTAVTTAVLDSLVAILAGVIIFPAVFSFGLSPEAGPTLVFEVLPYIFNQLPVGQLWSTLFFLLLFLASITSTVSMSEISITYFCEERRYSRRRATLVSSAISLVGGLLCALSFGPLSHLTICSLTIFNLFDYVTSNIALPLGGMIISVFIGRMARKHLLATDLADGHRVTIKLIVFCLTWICPVAIFLIFLNSIGII